MQRSLSTAPQSESRSFEFQSRDPDHAGATVVELYGRTAEPEFTRIGQSFALQYAAVALGATILLKVDAVGVKFKRVSGDAVCLIFPLKGEVGSPYATVGDAIPAQAAGVARPFERFEVAVPRSAAAAVYVPVHVLVERAEQLTSQPYSSALLSELPEMIDLSAPAGAALARSVRAACLEMKELGPLGLEKLVASGYTELFHNLAAPALFPSIARALAKPSPFCGTRITRQARDYIHANSSENIDLAQLASSCGVSMRALQESFKRAYGCSPRDFLMHCRLEKARESLMWKDQISSITEIALASGFSDHSFFSIKYREKYGELPSQTMRRTRR